MLTNILYNHEAFIRTKTLGAVSDTAVKHNALKGWSMGEGSRFISRDLPEPGMRAP